MLSGNSFLKEDKNEIESKNEFKILPKQLPTCNVLWVGQPCDRKTVYEITKRTGTIIDHDINSIVELSTKLENPISYWCLDKYVDLYKERFSKMGVKDKVTVHSIEGFLKECTQSENKTIKDGALFVLSLINLLISKGEKSKIIELITIKDCFSLFLLLANGGYTLDSNLFPTQNHSLPDFSHFCAPSSQYSTDCWMMFSPKEDPNLITGWESYVNAWEDKEDGIRIKLEKGDYFEGGNKEMYSWTFNHILAESILQAVKLSIKGMDSNEEKSWFATSANFNNHSALYLENLGMLKAFNNTHKPEMYKDVKWLSWLKQDDDKFFKERVYFSIPDLEFMIAKSKNYTPKPTKCLTYFEEALKKAVEEENQKLATLVQNLRLTANDEKSYLSLENIKDPDLVFDSKDDAKKFVDVCHKIGADSQGKKREMSGPYSMDFNKTVVFLRKEDIDKLTKHFKKDMNEIVKDFNAVFINSTSCILRCKDKEVAKHFLSDFKEINYSVTKPGYPRNIIPEVVTVMKKGIIFSSPHKTINSYQIYLSAADLVKLEGLIQAKLTQVSKLSVNL